MVLDWEGQQAGDPMTRWQILAAAAAAAILAGVLIAFVVPWWMFYPLGVCSGKACGYQWWSGIAGSFLMGGGMWTGLALFTYRHNCHHHGCLRIAFHAHPEHGHAVCKRHYQEHPDGRIPGKEAAGS